VRWQTTVNGKVRTVQIGWPPDGFAYGPLVQPQGLWWHGTLTQQQRDIVGTNYRRNRVYDSQTGRFTQPDPIGLAGGLNLYGYAGGDPINFSDPFGLEPCKVTGKWGEAVVDESVWQDFAIAMDEAMRNGYEGGVNDSFRSQADQTALYEAGRTTVRGGGSHQAGTGVDLQYLSRPPAEREALRNAMNKHGFAQTYGGRHHFEHQSTRGNPQRRQQLVRENANHSADNVGACGSGNETRKNMRNDPDE
jgi:RHS repeat-associated protein